MSRRPQYGVQIKKCETYKSNDAYGVDAACHDRNQPIASNLANIQVIETDSSLPTLSHYKVRHAGQDHRISEFAKISKRYITRYSFAFIITITLIICIILIFAWVLSKYGLFLYLGIAVGCIMVILIGVRFATYVLEKNEYQLPTNKKYIVTLEYDTPT